MPHRTWEDFPLRAESPVVESERDRERVVRIAGTRYLELPDNGWQLLFAWLAGPRRACRRVDRTPQPVRVVHRGAGLSFAPRTDADQRLVDEVVNDYLREAGVPPRPSGFTWYVELPARLGPRELHRAVEFQVRRANALRPAQVRHAVLAAIRDLY